MEKSLIVLLSFFVCVSSAQGDDLKLELASVVFRHGARSPIRTFPNDRYTESDWPQGYGQLSIRGMNHQYHLGQLLRERYVGSSTQPCAGLICGNYTRVQVHVQSTDVDRTLMSAVAQLSSFFPPDDSQRFNDSIPWQPIPIHTVPTMNDSILRATDNCPLYGQLLRDDLESAAYKEKSEEYKDFFADLSNKTGTTVNLSTAWGIEDTLKIEHEYDGFEAPSWATPEVMETLQSLADYTLTRMYNSTLKRKLYAGNWMNKVLGDMMNKANPADNKTYADMKLFLYSAHDTTVAAMTSGLDVFSGHQPGYATAFLVELYSDSSKNYYVKMFRRDGPMSDEFVPLNASYCKNPVQCTLEEFRVYVEPLVPTNFAVECKSVAKDLEKENEQLKISVISLGSVLCLVLLATIVMAVVLITYCRKRHRRRLYGALHSEA